MNNKTIADYLQKQVDWKEKSMVTMDRRYKIPKKLKAEIKELKEMVEYLTKI